MIERRSKARIRFDILSLATGVGAALILTLPTPLRAQDTAWSRVNVPAGPSARRWHAMAYDAARGLTVLFGGYDNGIYFGDTWDWNGTIWAARAVVGPSSRAYHAMGYDASRGVVVLFGGHDSIHYTGLSDTWEWNGSSWAQRASTGPPGRFAHRMAYDPARAVTVLFGGIGVPVGGGNIIYYGDTWEWNGANWTQRAASGPSPRAYHTMAYDAARSGTILFGGNYGYSLYADTWIWNGIAWEQRAVTGPPAMNQHSMAYDTARRVTTLFGGNDGRSNTWEWNGVGWTERAVTAPASRSAAAMVFDLGRSVTVLFGGTIGLNSPTSETWEYLTAPLPSGLPEAGAFCAGGSASLRAAASGSAPLAYQWRRETTNLIDGGNISGAATAVLTINPVMQADAASNYNVVISNAAGSITAGNAALVVHPTGTGDANADGVLDVRDVVPFVRFLLASEPRSLAGYCAADMDGDGLHDGADVQPFVHALISP